MLCFEAPLWIYIAMQCNTCVEMTARESKEVNKKRLILTAVMFSSPFEQASISQIGKSRWIGPWRIQAHPEHFTATLPGVKGKVD